MILLNGIDRRSTESKQQFDSTWRLLWEMLISRKHLHSSLICLIWSLSGPLSPLGKFKANSHFMQSTRICISCVSFNMNPQNVLLAKWLVHPAVNSTLIHSVPSKGLLMHKWSKTDPKNFPLCSSLEWLRQLTAPQSINVQTDCVK